VENQVDEMASMDNSCGNNNSSAVHENGLGRFSTRLKHAIQKLRKSNAVKFALFKEDFPKHHIIEHISPLHAVLVSYLSFFLGLFGFVFLAYTTFLGFIAYYIIVAVVTLQVLHYLCDR